VSPVKYELGFYVPDDAILLDKSDVLRNIFTDFHYVLVNLLRRLSE
jgi:hypothetical protein